MNAEKAQTPAGGRAQPTVTPCAVGQAGREVAAVPPAGRLRALICRIRGHVPRRDATSWGVWHNVWYCARCLDDLPLPPGQANCAD